MGELYKRLTDAASIGDVEEIQALVGKGADVNATDGSGCTALHWAASSRNVEAVQAVLDKGANVNVKIDADGRTRFTGPLSTATCNRCKLSSTRVRMSMPRTRMAARHWAW